MGHYHKKTTFSNLSSNNSRKERSMDALKRSNKKKISTKVLEDRHKRYKEWKDWWG